MVIAIIILSIALLFSLGLALFCYNAWNMVDKKYAQKCIDYLELEKGRDEQETNYEQQFLSLHELVDAQAASLKTRIADCEQMARIAEYHADHCIPDYAPILGFEDYHTLVYYIDNHEKYKDEIARLHPVDG